MLVLSSHIPGAEGFDWTKFEDMPFTISLRSERLIYDLRLLSGCVCLTTGSAQQLQRSRQDFEREANVEDRASAANESVRVVTEKDVAFDKSKQLQTQLHSTALQIANQLLDRAVAISEGAVEEMCEWEVVEADWLIAFSYCKALSRFSLTRSEMSKLTNMGRSSALRYDELKLAMKVERQKRRRQAAAEKMASGMRVGIGLKRWKNKSSRSVKLMKEGKDGAGKGIPRTPKTPKGGPSAMRRLSLNSAVDLGGRTLAQGLADLSLAALGTDTEDEEEEEEEPVSTPPVNYWEREKMAAQFGQTKASRAITGREAIGVELLDLVRNAAAEGKDEATAKAIVDDFVAAHPPERGAEALDPWDRRDAQLQMDRLIGRKGQEDALSPKKEQLEGLFGTSSAGGVDERDEKAVFTEKYLKAGRITIFYTTSTYSQESVLKHCQAVRGRLAAARDVRAEYDVFLGVNSGVVEALKRYFTQSYTLPQVFFGKDLIGGWENIDSMSTEELQSYFQQFLEQSQSWMEVGWEELSFFGAKLGAGAQGTVRKARWKGNDYAVKSFKTEDVLDFKEEVRVLEHLRHPNVVTFYGAVTRNSEHHAIVQELCLGSVYDYLQKFGKAVGAEGLARLNLPTRIRYAHDAAKGLIFLHSRKVIHCDLKTSNLLVANDASKTVKLCDFSMSRIGGGAKPWLSKKTASGTKMSVNADQSKDPDSDGAEAGTPGFISPEEMMGDIVTTKSDVYSFAMILWELLTSDIPFHSFLYGPGITPSLAKLRCIEICTNDLRPEMPASVRSQFLLSSSWFVETEQWLVGLCAQATIEKFFGIEKSVYALLQELIAACWRRQAVDRPDFEQIAKSLVVRFLLLVVRFPLLRDLPN